MRFQCLEHKKYILSKEGEKGPPSCRLFQSFSSFNLSVLTLHRPSNSSMGSASALNVASSVSVISASLTQLKLNDKFTSGFHFKRGESITKFCSISSNGSVSSSASHGVSLYLWCSLFFIIIICCNFWFPYIETMNRFGLVVGIGNEYEFLNNFFFFSLNSLQ